jgi:hypothetical protein
VRALAILAAVILAMGLLSGELSVTAAPEAAAECRGLLDRTLADMSALPPLKEELATGLMWMRLDALEALEAGDVETCLKQARRAAALLEVD